MKKGAKISPFSLTGQLKGLIYAEGYKLKYLRLEVAQQEYWIKVDKEQRQDLEKWEKTNIPLKVVGTAKISPKTGKLKLKADLIELEGTNHQCPVARQSSLNSILICQKSSCWRRGGESVYRELTQSLDKYGLKDQIKIKKTGCLKKCKKGPNLVFLPERTHHTCVQASEIPHLLRPHCQKQTN